MKHDDILARVKIYGTCMYKCATCKQTSAYVNLLPYVSTIIRRLVMLLIALYNCTRAAHKIFTFCS